MNKYGWVDTGSSFLPSEIIAAFLWAQLENLDMIQEKRKAIWNQYYEGLEGLAGKGYFTLPRIPGYAANNAHMFYVVCRSLEFWPCSTTSACIRVITIPIIVIPSRNFPSATGMQTVW